MQQTNIFYASTFLYTERAIHIGFKFKLIVQQDRIYQIFIIVLLFYANYRKLWLLV